MVSFEIREAETYGDFVRTWQRDVLTEQPISLEEARNRNPHH